MPALLPASHSASPPYNSWPITLILNPEKSILVKKLIIAYVSTSALRIKHKREIYYIRCEPYSNIYT